MRTGVLGEPQEIRGLAGIAQPGRRAPCRARSAAALTLLAVACLAVASCTGATSSAGRTAAAPPATTWLCRPGTANDPCAVSLATTQVAASGAAVVTRTAVASAASRFDCFYVYPRVGPAKAGTGSGSTLTAQSVRQPALAAAATQEAARFSQVCRVWAPVYQQGAADDFGTAAASVQAAFEDYLAHDNDGRPIIFIGHSEGAATLIELLSKLVDGDPGLRSRMVLAILLGGNVEVPAGKVTGGSFRNIPLCTSPGQAGCVIAYSSFPGTPPAGSMFGRPGQGISLSIGQTATSGLQVACEQADGASWLQITKATGPSDHRPAVTESDGPAYGYHPYDVNLALGNLVTDVAATESSWSPHTNA